MDIGAEPEHFFLGAVNQRQFQRRAGVVVPDLHRVDAVPMRSFAVRQQIQDRGRGRAAVDLPRIAEGFAVMAAFRMRLELKRADHVGGGGSGHDA